jgi:hypothetical protein
LGSYAGRQLADDSQPRRVAGTRRADVERLDGITIHSDVVVGRYIEGGYDVLGQCLTQDVEDWALFGRKTVNLIEDSGQRFIYV